MRSAALIPFDVTTICKWRCLTNWNNLFLKDLEKEDAALINIYRPQRSCEGYVFTGVILSTGGVGVFASVQAGSTPPPGADPSWADIPPGQTPLGADTPRSRHPPGTDTPSPGTDTPLGADTSQEQTPLGADTPLGAGIPRADTPLGADTPPPPRYGHCCRRYASFWNAFLFGNTCHLFT